MKPVLAFQPGDRAKFYGDPFLWTVRAVSSDAVLLTRRQGLHHSLDPVYTIIYWPFGWRGPHNSYGYGADSLEECQEVLRDLHSPRTNLEMSIRNSVYLDLEKVRRNQETIWEDKDEA